MIPRPDRGTEKQLRGFARLLPFALAAVAGVLWYRTGVPPTEWPAWAYALVATLLLWALAGMVSPPAIRPLYRLLVWLTWPIGLVLSTVLLAILFYLVVTPIGLALRLSGRDPLHRKRPSSDESLWRERRSDAPAGRYSRMF